MAGIGKIMGETFKTIVFFMVIGLLATVIAGLIALIYLTAFP